MQYKINLIYFTAIFTQSDSPTITGHGTIYGWDEGGLNVHITFKIERQPYNVQWKLTVTEGTIFGKNAKDNKELALQVKDDIKREMNALIKRKLANIAL